MKQADAKNEIRIIWINWKNQDEKYGLMCGLIIHAYLQNDRPNLLSFKYGGDKYQLINIWCEEWQRNYPKPGA